MRTRSTVRAEVELSRARAVDQRGDFGDIGPAQISGFGVEFR